MSTASDDGASPTSLPPSSTPPAPEPAPPLREDMLQNAVAFLTHPKVKDSPEATKRSFLDRKGLTTAEVDEAFRRVPPPSQQQVTSSPPAVPVSSGPSGLVTYQQPQSSQQQGALVAHPPPGYTLVPSGGPSLAAQPQPQTPPAQEPVRWSQVVLGIGVLATGLYAVKSLVFPYLHDAYCSWSERTKAQREAQEQQQRALSELVVTLRACKDEMASNSGRLEELMRTLQAQQAGQALASQRAESSSAELSRELAGLKAALQQLTLSPLSSNGHASHSQRLNPLTESRPAAWPPTVPQPVDDTGFAAYASGSKRTYPSQLDSSHHPSSPGIGAPSPPFPGGYDGILPPPGGYRGGYQDPVPKAGSPACGSISAVSERQQEQGAALPCNTHTTGHSMVAPGASNSMSVGSTGTATAKGAAASIPYPPSFVEVMEMVSKGVTPPNVRSDINDKPPDPSRPPSEPRMPPRPKPWESAASAAKTSGLPFPPSPSPPSPNAAHLPPLISSVNPSTPSASPARAANGVAGPQETISFSLPSTNASLAANSDAVGNDVALLHSSQEWLGANSPLQVIKGKDLAAPSHSGSLSLQRVEDGSSSSSSGSKQQAGAWGSSKLNAAAEPYAPSWAPSVQRQQQQQLQQQQQQLQQQQQPATSLPASASTLAESSAHAGQELLAHNPISKGMEQQETSPLPEGSGADGPHQDGQHSGNASKEAIGAGSSSTDGSSSRPSAVAPSAQTPAEGTPPASRPLSVLQPNPSWKPPPPPMPTVSHLRPKKASVSPSTNGPLATAPSSTSQHGGDDSEGMQGTAAVQAEKASTPSRLAEHEGQAPVDGSKEGGGGEEHPVEVPAESPAWQLASKGRPGEEVQ